MKLKLSFILGLFVCFSAFSAVYSDPQGRFKFEYNEANWEVAPIATPKADKPTGETTLVNLQRKQADDKYRARFSVVYDPTQKLEGSEAAQVAAYQKHTVGFLKDQQFSISTPTTVKLPKVNEPAFEVGGSQRTFGLTLKQVVVIKDKSAYLLTSAARIAKFDGYAKEIQAIYDSFELGR